MRYNTKNTGASQRYGKKAHDKRNVSSSYEKDNQHEVQIPLIRVQGIIGKFITAIGGLFITLCTFVVSFFDPRGRGEFKVKPQNQDILDQKSRK